jgi:hypothetical protein
MAQTRTLSVLMLSGAWVCFGAACAAVLGIEDPLTFVGNDGASADSAPMTPTSSRIAFVQSQANSTATLAFDRPVTTHNAIVAAMTVSPSPAQSPSVTDSLGNHYSMVAGPYVAPQLPAIALYLFAAFDVVGGPDTVLPTVTASGEYLELYINEYAGLVGVDGVSLNNDGITSDADRTARHSRPVL